MIGYAALEDATATSFLRNNLLKITLTLFFVLIAVSVSYAGCTGAGNCAYIWDSTQCGLSGCTWADNFNWTLVIKNMTGEGVQNVNVSFHSPGWISSMTSDHPMAENCSYFEVQLLTNISGGIEVNSSRADQNISRVNGPDCLIDQMTIEARYYGVNLNVSRMSKPVFVQKDAGMRPSNAPAPVLFLTHAVTLRLAPKWEEGYFAIARNSTEKTHAFSVAENCTYNYIIYDNATGTQYQMGKVENNTLNLTEGGKYYKEIYLPVNRTYLLTFYAFQENPDISNCPQTIFTPEQTFEFNTTPNPDETTANMSLGLVRAFEPFLNWTLVEINGTLITATPADRFVGLAIHPYANGMSPYSAGFSPLGLLSLTNASEYLNETSGFYNLSLPGSASLSYVLEASAVNDTTGNYSGGFAIVEGLSDKTIQNITLYDLYGANSTTSNNWQGINTSKLVFLFNDTSTSQYSTQANMQAKTTYPDGTSLTWMVFSETSGQNLMFPVTVGTNVTAVVFSPSHAPLKKDITFADFAAGNGFNYTIQLKQFDMKDPSGDTNSGSGQEAPMMLIMQHTPECDIPIDFGMGPPDESQTPDEQQAAMTSVFTAHACYLSGPSPASNFDPLSAAILQKVNTMVFQMTSDGPPIITYYIGVDLFSSGPPDVQYEAAADEDTAIGVDLTASTAKLWQFGSTAPDIYDKVYVGMPAMADELSGASVRVTVPYLYTIGDSGWTLAWNTSADAMDSLPTGYNDYITYYKADDNPLNTSIVCSNDNRSATCFYNSSVFTNSSDDGRVLGGIVWLLLPHFSGTGPYYFAGQPGAPSLNITAPLNLTYTLDTSINFNITVIDATWTTTNTSLLLYSDPSDSTSYTINATNTTTENNTAVQMDVSAAFADGTYYWGFNSTNGDGNTTFSGIFTLYVDATAPSFDAGEFNDTTLFAADAFTWTFNMTELNYNASLSTAHLVSNTNPDVVYLNSSDSSFDISTSALIGTNLRIVAVNWTVPSTTQDGNYSFVFNSTDNMGNFFGYANDTRITINTPATFATNQSVNDTSVNENESVSFYFSYFDEDFNYANLTGAILNSSGVPIRTLYYDANTFNNISCTSADYLNHTCTVTWNALNDDNEAVPDDVYYLNISTQDDAGLISHMRSTLTSGNVTIDTTVPSYTFSETNYSTTSGWSKTNSTVTIVFVISDASYNISNIQVYVVNVTNTAVQFANSSDQIALSTLGSTITAAWNSTAAGNVAMSDSTYAIVVNHTDGAGNTAGTILTGAQTVIDNTLPSVSSVTIDNGTAARVWATDQTLYVNGTFAENNTKQVQFSLFNTSSNLVLINATNMTNSITAALYRSVGFDSLYIPIGNWTANVTVMDYAGNIGVGTTTILSNAALRVTLTGTATAEAAAASSTPVVVANFTTIAKSFPYVGGYLNLTGPSDIENYINNYNGQKQAFLSNVSASPTSGDKFQLGGNAVYETPDDEPITLTSITQAELSGTIFNFDVSALDVYTGSIYMYITPYVSTTGRWVGTYGLGIFTST